MEPRRTYTHDNAMRFVFRSQGTQPIGRSGRPKSLRQTKMAKRPPEPACLLGLSFAFCHVFSATARILWTRFALRAQLYSAFARINSVRLHHIGNFAGAAQQSGRGPKLLPCGSRGAPTLSKPSIPLVVQAANYFPPRRNPCHNHRWTTTSFQRRCHVDDRLVAVGVDGRKEPLSNWRQGGLDKWNTKTPEVALLLGCESHAAPPQSIVSVEEKDGAPTLKFAPPTPSPPPKAGRVAFLLLYNRA